MGESPSGLASVFLFYPSSTVSVLCLWCSLGCFYFFFVFWRLCFGLFLCAGVFPGGAWVTLCRAGIGAG